MVLSCAACAGGWSSGYFPSFRGKDRVRPGRRAPGPRRGAGTRDERRITESRETISLGSVLPPAITLYKKIPRCSRLFSLFLVARGPFLRVADCRATARGPPQHLTRCVRPRARSTEAGAGLVCACDCGNTWNLHVLLDFDSALLAPRPDTNDQGPSRKRGFELLSFISI